jgi:3'(2'), 5'-bisphosphate nucleotidase
MDQQSLRKLLEEVKKISFAAGRKILESAMKTGSVDYKEDGSPVTDADIASHDEILSGLNKLEKDLPVVSEEDDLDTFRNDCKSSEYYWLVDPLDGTKDFIKGNGEYTVNIALVHGDSPILGAIYAPALDVLYYAAQKCGAWKDSHDNPAKPLTGSGSKTPLTAVISRSHPSAETSAFLSRYKIKRTIKAGSSLKICLVAEGTADIYPRLGPTCLWDTAAGKAIAKESGCMVVDLKGNELLYDYSKGIIQKSFLVYSPVTFEYDKGVVLN